MGSVLDAGYNMAMLHYKQMRANARANSNVVIKELENIKTDDEPFQVDTTTDSKITYNNTGSNITYIGEVEALKSPKIQSYIKQHRIDEIVEHASEKFNIPINLIYKVIETESYFNKDCVSQAGAVGLMQLMPFNFDTYGVTDATDPYQNIMAGVEHLRRYIDMFDGNVKLGLAAYNAGPGNVKKYGGVPPFKETQNYIRKILGENA